jgi:hypothetical protein
VSAYSSAHFLSELSEGLSLIHTHYTHLLTFLHTPSLVLADTLLSFSTLLCTHANSLSSQRYPRTLRCRVVPAAQRMDRADRSAEVSVRAPLVVDEAFERRLEEIVPEPSTSYSSSPKQVNGDSATDSPQGLSDALTPHT